MQPKLLLLDADHYSLRHNNPYYLRNLSLPASNGSPIAAWAPHLPRFRVHSFVLLLDANNNTVLDNNPSYLRNLSLPRSNDS